MSDNLTAILRAMSEQEREPITRSQCQSLMAAADELDRLRSAHAKAESERLIVWDLLVAANVELDRLRAFVREVNGADVVGWAGFAPFGLLSPTDREIDRDEWAENGWTTIELIPRPARMEV